MVNLNKKQILESIGLLYEKAENCKLENSFFESAKDEINLLQRYFKISECQILFLAVIIALNYKGKTVDLNDLIENIYRKSEINEILYDKKCSINEIQQFCNDELINSESPKIVFGKSN